MSSDLKFGAPMFQCVCDYLYQIIICGAFYPNYFFKRQFDEVEAVKSLSNHDPMNTVMVSLAWVLLYSFVKQAVRGFLCGLCVCVCVCVCVFNLHNPFFCTEFYSESLAYSFEKKKKTF